MLEGTTKKTNSAAKGGTMVMAAAANAIEAVGAVTRATAAPATVRTTAVTNNSQ